MRTMCTPLAGSRTKGGRWATSWPFFRDLCLVETGVFFSFKSLCCGSAAGVRQELKQVFFMNGFGFLWGPYGLMGLLGLCAVLLLLVRYLFGMKSSGGVQAGPDLGSGLDAEEVLDGYSGVMGRAKPEIGVSQVSADEFGFSGPADEDALGILSGAQEKIREICQVLADRDGTKEDFFSMFGLVRESYPGLEGHPLRASLDHFIREQVPFFLSVAELESLWD